MQYLDNLLSRGSKRRGHRSLFISVGHRSLFIFVGLFSFSQISFHVRRFLLDILFHFRLVGHQMACCVSADRVLCWEGSHVCGSLFMFVGVFSYP